MLAFVQWLSETPASAAIRDVDWVIPALQTLHILSIAMVLSSMLMLDLRVLRVTASQSLAQAAHRFEPWIWSGLAFLAATGLPLIIAEPKRTLPNPTFQLKLVLIAAAVAATYALRRSLRESGAWQSVSGRAPGAAKLFAVGALLLWCASCRGRAFHRLYTAGLRPKRGSGGNLG